MSQLTYLIDEICVGLEIYYTGRQGGQYLKTAYILCDDYTELTSKLFLLMNKPNWSDHDANGNFKSYRDVLKDVRNVVSTTKHSKLAEVQNLHNNMKACREYRNSFFHSARLLELSITQRSCVEAFCDLLGYGALLFGTEWVREVNSSRNLETLEILLLLEKKSFTEPTIQRKVNDILEKWRTNTSRLPRKGANVTRYPDDLHLRMCVIYGGQDFRDALMALL